MQVVFFTQEALFPQTKPSELHDALGAEYRATLRRKRLAELTLLLVCRLVRPRDDKEDKIVGALVTKGTKPTMKVQACGVCLLQIFMGFSSLPFLGAVEMLSLVGST